MRLEPSRPRPRSGRLFPPCGRILGEPQSPFGDLLMLPSNAPASISLRPVNPHALYKTPFSCFAAVRSRDCRIASLIQETISWFLSFSRARPGTFWQSIPGRHPIPGQSNGGTTVTRSSTSRPLLWGSLMADIRRFPHHGHAQMESPSKAVASEVLLRINVEIITSSGFALLLSEDGRSRTPLPFHESLPYQKASRNARVRSGCGKGQLALSLKASICNSLLAGHLVVENARRAIPHRKLMATKHEYSI